MLNRLPNLNGLRVLVAVARCASFTRAAEDLGVTQSAVSKQISSLEAELGQPLFRRFHRRIEITPFGQRVADLAGSAFAQIETGLREMDVPAPDQIRLFGDADFLEQWLFPRLPRFEAENPAIRISITAQIGMNNPPEGEWDCAVIWGRGDWSGCLFQALMTNRVFPVAASEYFASLGRSPRLSDIPERHLIHDQTRFWWRAFREATGDRVMDPGSGRIYNRSVLCLAAAARGDGVTIGDEVTTRPQLESGALVCPFDIVLPSPDAYFLVFPEGHQRQPPVSLFTDWLRSEAEEHAAFYRRFWAGHGV